MPCQHDFGCVACIKVKLCYESTSVVDAKCLMLHDWCCKYVAFVLDFAKDMDVDVGQQDTLSPCDGRSKSIEMDVGINVGTNARVDGINGLVAPSIRLC